MRTLSENMQKIKASWVKELKTQSPAHIFKQAIGTLFWMPVLLLAMLWARVRRLAVIGYRHARNYYFLALLILQRGPGFYIEERKRILRKEEWKQKTRKAKE